MPKPGLRQPTLLERVGRLIRDQHIFALLGFLLALTGIALLLFGDTTRGLLQSVGVELGGIIVLFFLLETLSRTRDRTWQAQQEEQHKRDLEYLQKQIAIQIRQELRNYIQSQETARLKAARSIEERQPILDSMRVGGLLRGAELLNTTLVGTQLPRAELQDAILRQAALKRIDLHEADLRRADLWQADLEQAQLAAANMEEANLYMAQLHQANMQGANLKEANLGQATIQGADLGEALLDGANLWGADLAKADLENAQLRGAVMVDANLSRALLWHANLEGAILLNADLTDADLTNTNLRGARFMTVDQLRDKYLRSVVLPDGHKLAEDESWKAEFLRWLDLIKPDDNGFIVPTYEAMDLRGQPRFTIKYLAEALSLRGATLPDGAMLPNNNNWRRVFERWAQSAEVDQYGHVVPNANGMPLF